MRQLGSASVQIVHDLKNQLNGLKLYATFLKKRMEKGERPADEQETIGKIIAGLERAATDMTVLVRYGRPLDLRPQPNTDLARLLADAAGDAARLDAQGQAFEGDFDPPLLGEALQAISNSVSASSAGNGQPTADGDQTSPRIRLRRDDLGGAPHAIIEWDSITKTSVPADVFNSFAGGQGLRLALAARIIRSHGGEVSQESGVLRARLPLSKG